MVPGAHDVDSEDVIDILPDLENDSGSMPGLEDNQETLRDILGETGRLVNSESARDKIKDPRQDQGQGQNQR